MAGYQRAAACNNPLFAAVATILVFQLIICGDDAGSDAPFKCVNETGYEVPDCRCLFGITDRLKTKKLSIDCMFERVKGYRIVIEENAVARLQHMTELKIELSKITHIPDGMFCNSSHLRSLSFLGNSVEDINKIGLSLKTCDSHSEIVNVEANLDFQGNKISALQGYAFSRYTTLDTLDLSNNLLSELNQDVFGGLVKIRTLRLNSNRLFKLHLNPFLHLSANEIDLSMNKLTSDALYSVNNINQTYLSLHVLNVAENSIHLINNSMLSNLKELKELDLDKNEKLQVMDFAFSFNNLLEVLYLNDIELMNLTSEMLSGLNDSLEYILLHDNYLALSAICNFRNFGKLKQLDLTNNFLYEVDDYSKCLEGMETCPSHDLEVVLSKNELTTQSLHLIGTFFANCSMEKVDLTSNNLTESTIFKYFNATEIIISHNQVEILDLTDLSSKTTKLEIRNNRIKYVIDTGRKYEISRGYVKRAAEFNLIFEKRTKESQHTRPNKGLITYCLGPDRRYKGFAIKDVKNSSYFCTFKNTNWKKRKSSSKSHSIINNCILSNDFLISAAASVVLSEINEHKQFVCLPNDNKTKNSNCNFDIWCKPYLKCIPPCTCYYQRVNEDIIVDCHQYLRENSSDPSIKMLESYGTVHVHAGNDYINSNTFNSSMFFEYQIRELYLNNSGINFIGNYSFGTLSLLRLLNLSRNKIKLLSEFAFYGIATLQYLYLSHCELEYINLGVFNNLTSLVHLALNNNRLKQFSFWQIVPIASLKVLELHNNPFTCDCKFMQPFVQRFLNNVQIFKYEQLIVCTDEKSGTEIQIINFDLEQCDFNVKQLLGIIIALLTVVIGLIIYVFVRRIELQVMIYSRFGLRLFHNNNDEELDRDKPWDAFLCYCSLDYRFLLEEFLPKLEEIENPYKILIHQRSFVIGQFISENIMMAVARSKRTIVLMNDNFAESSYCQYEFRVAHAQLMTDRFPRLILILIGDEPKNLEDEMKFYMRTNTYLKWGDPYFWEKLYFALPGRKTVEENQGVVQETNC